MTDSSANLALPYLLPAQAQKHVTHNEALARLDVLAQLAVEGFGATAPPVAPQEGEVHALGPVPTGAWAGQGDRLAAWIGGAWVFVVPRTGWRAWGRAEGRLRIRTAGGWQDATALGGLDNLPGVGIGTAHDATNRLAVAGAASLFSHGGAGHQMKINKAAAADTASLLFQSNWAGRAEIGLTGNDNLSVRVSADGTTFATALSVDRTTARPTAPAGLTVTGTLTGTAVQQSAGDTTAGRLALAQHALLRTAMTGTVSQSGGVPTGAVIERGSNANGEFTRWADGTQICWSTVQTSTAGEVTWTFPAAFAAAARVQATPYHNAPALATVAGSSLTTSVQVSGWNLSGARIQVFTPLAALGRWF